LTTGDFIHDHVCKTLSNDHELNKIENGHLRVSFTHCLPLLSNADYITSRKAGSEESLKDWEPFVFLMLLPILAIPMYLQNAAL